MTGAGKFPAKDITLVLVGGKIASILATMIACGGGSIGGVSPPPPSPPPPPPPPPQTVNISAIAQAALIVSDSGNQKTLGPIVITLK